MNGGKLSVRYVFVRARQLEGTYPGDKATGTWPITEKRISYGWGSPPEEAWPYNSGWPPEDEPPDIDLIAKRCRLFMPYRRVRTIDDCQIQLPVGVSLEITDKWANPWRGQIPRPSGSDIIFPIMHHVLIVSFHPERDEFKFMNSWGPEWGDNGYGYIRAQRLATTWSEGWHSIPGLPKMTPLDGTLPHLRTGELKQSDGSILHWLDIVGDDDDRLGWASAIQTPTSFEIEELFVRPTQRGTGWGRKLFQTIESMAKNRVLSIKVWISFADTAPENLKVIEKIVRPSGLSIQASGVRWAPLAALPESDRSSEVVPTFPYPENPPSGPSELVQLARDIAISLGTGFASSFLYDAFKSWVKPQNGKRIEVKLGDVEISTSEVSVDEFRKLLKAVNKAQKETDIRRALLEAGIKITLESSRHKPIERKTIDEKKRLR